MPIFMIERQFVDQLSPTIEDAEEINAINDEEEVSWLMSFLSADKRKTYCLYEAESPDAIRRAAERAGIPAGAITELGARSMPDASLEPVL